MNPEDFLRQIAGSLPEPSLHSLILKHGRAFEQGARPGKLRLGRLGQCYLNAGTIAIRHASLYRYCEGYATRNVPEAMGLPVLHGWLVDKEDRAIDVTWPEQGNQYYGVTFTEKELIEGVMEARYWGLFDNCGVGSRILLAREAVAKERDVRPTTPIKQEEQDPTWD
jgi:hypothetical protein